MEWFTVIGYVVGSFIAFIFGLSLGFRCASKRCDKLAKDYEKLFGTLKEFFEAGYKEGRWRKKGCERAYQDFSWNYFDTHKSPDPEDLNEFPGNRRIG